MCGHTWTWSMFFCANDWLHWPHFIKLISLLSGDSLNLLLSSQSSTRMRSSFKAITGSEMCRVLSARTELSPEGGLMFETTGPGIFWCHEMWLLLGIMSRDTGDFRNVFLEGVCEVTAGWVETGAENFGASFDLSVGWIWPWAASTSCRSLVPRRWGKMFSISPREGKIRLGLKMKCKWKVRSVINWAQICPPSEDGYEWGLQVPYEMRPLLTPTSTKNSHKGLSLWDIVMPLEAILHPSRLRSVPDVYETIKLTDSLF